MDYFYSAVTNTEVVKTMGYFILQSLQLRISKHWFLLFCSHYNKGYQNNALFYSAVTRTKDICPMVSFIQGSLEQRISKQWYILFNSHSN
jgi:hypothetical protein